MNNQSQQRILIVDDEEGMRDSLSFMLESEGFTNIQTASNGEVALQEMARQPCAVVITDLEMPKLNGYALMQAIRTRWPYTIAIAITGYGSTESAAECLRRGAFDYITKPFNVDVILAVIRRALDRFRLEAEARARTEQIAVMAEITKIINSSLDIQEVFGPFGEAVKRLIDFDVMNITVFDDAHGQLRILATSTAANGSLALGKTVSLVNSRLGQVASTGRPCRRERLSGVSGFEDEASLFLEGIRSIMALPLEVKRKIIGTFLIGSHAASAYDESSEETVKQIAGLVATAANNMLLYEQLQTQLARLRRTQSQLVRSARMAAVGELADGVAHEINNPLSVVLGIVQLLLRQSDVPPQIKEDLEKISVSAVRIASITRSFIEFAKPVNIGNPVPLDVSDLFESALLLVQGQFGEVCSSVRIVRMFPQNPVLVKGNGNQLRRALVAVIRNAFEAMGKAPASTSAAGHHELLLEVRTVDRNGHGFVELIVEDTGVGIAEEHLERIFEPGFTTKIEKGTVRGLGMGLFSAYGIIEAHDGAINVESTLGRGTRVVIALPALETST